MPEESLQEMPVASIREKNSGKEYFHGIIPETVQINLQMIDPGPERILADFIFLRKDNAYSRRTSSVFPGARYMGDVSDWMKFHTKEVRAWKVLNFFLENQSLILYPYLIVLDGKIKIQIKLLADFYGEEVFVRDIVRELRALNEKNIVKYIEYHAKNPRKISGSGEENPGSIINYSLDYKNLSFENQFVSDIYDELKQQLSCIENSDIHLQKKNLDLIKNDFIYSAVNRSVPVMKEICPGLFLPAEEGYQPGSSIVPHDEILYVYRIMGDILEKKTAQLADNLTAHGFAQLRSEMEQNEKENPSIPGKRQKRARMDVFCNLLENYSMKLNGGKWIHDMKNFINSFRIICGEMDGKTEKNQETAIYARYRELSEEIKKSSSKGNFIRIDPSAVFNADASGAGFDAGSASREVLERLSGDRDFCFCLNPETGLYYFASILYFLKVEAAAEKNKKKNPDDYSAVQIIKENLPELRPESRDYPSLLENFCRKNNRNDYDAAVNEIKLARMKDREENSSHVALHGNYPAGFAVATIAAFPGSLLGYIISLLFGLNGVTASAGSGILFFLAGYFFGQNYFSREKEMERMKAGKISGESRKNYTGNSSNSQDNPDEAEKALSVIFPAEFQSPERSIHTDQTLKESILKNINALTKNLPRTNGGLKHKEVEEMIRAVKNHPEMVVILVPPEFAAEGYPDNVILKRSDLRQEGVRKKIAEHFIERFQNKDAVRAKNDPKLAGYYRFFINTFETSEYKKYL